MKIAVRANRNPGRPITRDELARAVIMRLGGASWGDIGEALNRSGEAVRKRVFRHRPDLRDPLRLAGATEDGNFVILLRPEGVTAPHFSTAWFRQNQSRYAAGMRAAGYGGEAAARMRGSGASDGRQI